MTTRSKRTRSSKLYKNIRKKVVCMPHILPQLTGTSLASAGVPREAHLRPLDEHCYSLSFVRDGRPTRQESCGRVIPAPHFSTAVAGCRTLAKGRTHPHLGSDQV